MTTPKVPHRSDSDSPPTDVVTNCWTVWRIDDNGNVFVVSENLSREDADKLVVTYTERGHKQMYWVERSK